jgi:hypothetical protein
VAAGTVESVRAKGTAFVSTVAGLAVGAGAGAIATGDRDGFPAQAATQRITRSDLIES